MDKPKINNLIAKVQGRDLTLKQCADATRELNKMMLYTEELEQLILSGVSDIVHRAELKVLENVSDYIPCEIYSQAVISSQKKRDNVR